MIQQIRNSTELANLTQDKMQPPARQYSSGSLDIFEPVMVTPVIGNEFLKGKCSIVNDILRAPDAESRIRDLAIMSKSPFMIFGEVFDC